MAVLVDGILAAGIVIPDSISEKLKLIAVWPFRNTLSMFFILSNHFLQKHDVAAGSAEIAADLLQGEAAITHGEAFVKIESKNLEYLHDSLCLQAQAFSAAGRRRDEATYGY